jgi:hypothetical protein
MAKVVIHLGTPRILREHFFKADAERMALVRRELPYYTVGGTFETPLEGAAAAEEAFDLTNNPSRHEEREKLYGNGRSVSSGDVVEVDGVKYLCLSFGWEKL